MLLVHIGITSLRQFQCAPTTYVNPINVCFSPFFLQTSLLLFLIIQRNEHVEMNKFLCSLACTLMTIIDSQFYIIDKVCFIGMKC